MKIKDLWEKSGFNYDDISVLFQNYNPEDKITLEMIEKIEDDLNDIIDSQVDIYNSDLLEWLEESSVNADYVNRGKEIYGSADDIYKEIQQGEWLYYEELYNQIIEDIKEILEDEGEK